MNNKQYAFAVTEAASYTDRGAYISDLALSSVWGDAQDTEIPTERLEQLCEIWNATHMSVTEIRAAAGIRSMVELAEHFAIPYRTVQNWESGQRECAPYIRLMIQETLGLIKIQRG